VSDPWADPQWKEFVRHFREDAVKKIADSAIVISLIPDKDFDVKFACELGAALMMNKPLLGIRHPGAVINERLLRAFDEVIEIDMDTEAGQKAMREALDRMGLR
jgi:hypothetical protein